MPALRSFVPLAFLTITWGMNWSVMKIGATAMPPLWFRAISLVLGTAILAIVLAARGVSLRLPPATLGRVVRVAIPNIVVWYAIVTIAVTRLPAGRAAILGFTMPAWTALIGALVYRERLAPRTWTGVACAIAGVLLLLAGDLDALLAHPLGVALMLVAAVSWAWGTHLLRRASFAMDTLALTFWMMLVACPFIVVLSACLEGARWGLPADDAWWPIAYNALLVLAIGNFVWFSLARTLTPVASALSSMLIPVVGVFSGILLFGETPGWRDFVALALISVAVVAGLTPGRREAAA